MRASVLRSKSGHTLGGRLFLACAQMAVVALEGRWAGRNILSSMSSKQVRLSKCNGGFDYQIYVSMAIEIVPPRGRAGPLDFRARDV